MEKVITIDGRNIPFSCTAGTLRRYRQMFHRDILRDMKKITAAALESADLPKDAADLESADLSEDAAELVSVDLPEDAAETIENLAYIMAKQADPDIPDMDTWLDQFEPLSIYNSFPDLMDLWLHTNEAVERAKKKLNQ